MYNLILAAILPAVVLIWHIYRRDKAQPEPVSQLLLGFGWGILSLLVALVLVQPFSFFDAFGRSNMLGCAYNAFCCAAIPEECAKALCLFLFLRKNKYFDECMDGIVYAVTVGMGFAALENVTYLFGNYDNWIAVGVLRALLSVPGHFAFAVLMGYFFSLWRIKGDSNCFWLMLALPILAHGIFDFLLFYMNISEYFTIILLIAFFVFLHKIRLQCSYLIKAHLLEDTK